MQHKNNPNKLKVVYSHISKLFPNTVYVGEGSIARAHNDANRSPEWVETMKSGGYEIQHSELMPAAQAEALEESLIKSYRDAGWKVINGNDGGRGPRANRPEGTPNVFPKFDEQFNFLTVNIINQGKSFMARAGMNGFTKSFSWPVRGDATAIKAERFTEVVRHVQEIALRDGLNRKQVDELFDDLKAMLDLNSETSFSV